MTAFLAYHFISLNLKILINLNAIALKDSCLICGQWEGGLCMYVLDEGFLMGASRLSGDTHFEL